MTRIMLWVLIVCLIGTTAARADALTSAEKRALDDSGAVMRLRAGGLRYLKAIAEFRSGKLTITGKVGRLNISNGVLVEGPNVAPVKAAWTKNAEGCTPTDTNCTTVTDVQGYFKFVPTFAPLTCGGRLYVGIPTCRLHFN